MNEGQPGVPAVSHRKKYLLDYFPGKGGCDTDSVCLPTKREPLHTCKVFKVAIIEQLYVMFHGERISNNRHLSTLSRR